MITEIKEIYKCEHCKKLYQSKRWCLEHEKLCAKNPDNQRACFGCVHLIKKSETVYYDSAFGEVERKVDLLYCNKLRHFLYPPRVEHKGNMYETYPTINTPMPKTCNLFTDDFIGFEEDDDSGSHLTIV